MARFVKIYPRPTIDPMDSIEVNADAVTWISTPYPGLNRCELHMVGGEVVDVESPAWQIGRELNDPVRA